MPQAAVPATVRRCQARDHEWSRQCLRRAVHRLTLPDGRITFVCPNHARALLATQAALVV